MFRYEAQAGNIGVNIGVAAPMAYFPFSGSCLRPSILSLKTMILA